jgi:hypothetical protein
MPGTFEFSVGDTVKNLLTNEMKIVVNRGTDDAGKGFYKLANDFHDVLEQKEVEDRYTKVIR